MGALHTSLLLGVPLVESLINRSLLTDLALQSTIYCSLLVADAHALIRKP